MFWKFCVGLRHDVNIRTVRSMTSLNLILHVCDIRKFVMAISHGKQRLLHKCDEKKDLMVPKLCH